MYSDIVNFDFEFSLFEKNYVQKIKTRKLNEELEYIYFYCSEENSCFCPFKKYQDDYLTYLTELGLKLPKIDCSLPTKKWWGNDEDLELARYLNSKITSTNLAQEKGLNPEGVVVIKKYEEILDHLNRYDYKNWIFRDPFAMAGTNSIILQKSELEKYRSFFSKRLKDSPIILAPYFSRLMDLGFIFENDSFSVTWNLNTKSGRFKGGIVFENIESISLIIKERFNLDFWNILKIEGEIAGIFKGLGNKDIIQIDSFIYREENSIKFYPLVEVNARKTMGYFINKLKKFLPKDGSGLFLSLKNSSLLKVENFNYRLKSLGDILYSSTNKIGIIPLSPIDGTFSSFFISGASLEEVDRLKRDLWNKISHPQKLISPAFDFLE